MPRSPEDKLRDKQRKQAAIAHFIDKLANRLYDVYAAAAIKPVEWSQIGEPMQNVWRQVARYAHYSGHMLKDREPEEASHYLATVKPAR